MLSALTVDIEDYWSILSRDHLMIPDAEPTEAVVRNTEWFLEVLGRNNTKATFFILGEVARAFPSLIARIHHCGHEIGVHGFSHKQVFKLDQNQFRKEVDDCKKLLEDIISSPVYGHRAPAFSIMPDTKWALEILAEAGFEYDSSIFPISTRRYGWPGFSRDICTVQVSEEKNIIEVPLTTLNMFGKALPVAGGGYLRHFPYWVTKKAITVIQRKRPVIVYMHPYEIEKADTVLDTSRLNHDGSRKVRRMHSLQLRNRHTVKRKLLRLLQDFEFTNLHQLIKRNQEAIRENIVAINQGFEGLK